MERLSVLLTQQGEGCPLGKTGIAWIEGEEAAATLRLFFSPSRLLLLDDVALWAVLEGEDGVATFQCVLELYRWVAILSARWGQRSAFAWGVGASPEAAIGKLEEELRQRNDEGLLALFQQVVGDAGRD